MAVVQILMIQVLNRQRTDLINLHSSTDSGNAGDHISKGGWVDRKVDSCFLS
jgi:hypothetical protein